MRRDILSFGKISRADIQGCVQVVNFRKNPVRRACMNVACVVVWIGIRSREEAGKWIDPGARTQAGLTRI